jgi:hypothetical protein
MNQLTQMAQIRLCKDRHRCSRDQGDSNATADFRPEEVLAGDTGRLYPTRPAQHTDSVGARAVSKPESVDGRSAMIGVGTAKMPSELGQ